MEFFSPAFLNMRFTKTQWKDLNGLSLDTDMLRTLAVIDENKTVSQICDDANLQLLRVRESLYNLWRACLVVPVNSTNECRCHQLIEKIVKHRSMGNPALVKSIKAKLHMKGIDPNKFYPGAYDDPVVLEKLKPMARDLGILGFEDGDPPNSRFSKGRIRLVIDNIIAGRSQGNPDIARNLHAKLVLKGINPEEHTYDTVDDPRILMKVTVLAKKMGVTVPEPAASKSKGEIHRLIRAVITQRARGNPDIARTMRAKFVLKGINPENYGPDTEDDPIVLKSMQKVARIYGIDPDSQNASRVPKTQGRVNYILRAIIAQLSRGDPKAADKLKGKFISRGLNPDHYTDDTEDSPRLVERLEALAANLKVTL